MLGGEAQPQFRRRIRISGTGRRESTKQACTTDEIDADLQFRHALCHSRRDDLGRKLRPRRRIRSGIADLCLAEHTACEESGSLQRLRARLPTCAYYPHAIRSDRHDFDVCDVQNDIGGEIGGRIVHSSKICSATVRLSTIPPDRTGLVMMSSPEGPTSAMDSRAPPVLAHPCGRDQQNIRP